MIETKWFKVKGSFRVKFLVEVHDFGGGGGKRGVGLWYQRGSSGSTYGEDGTNEFLHLNVLIVRWTLVANLFWKGVLWVSSFLLV